MNNNDPNYHPKLYLLGIENTGWRRWVFGRWAYSSEPFRADIQRRARRARLQVMLEQWQTLGRWWGEGEGEG